MSDLRDNVVFITGGGSGLGPRWSSVSSKKVRGSPRWNCRQLKLPVCVSALANMYWQSKATSPATPTISARWIKS